MTRRKIVAIVAALASVTLTGCNQSGENPSSSSSVDTTPTSITTPSSSASSSSTSSSSKEEVTLETLWTDYDTITISEAIQIAAEAGETATSERYYIKGLIEEISNESYGEMTISDSTGELLVYGTYGADGKDRYPALKEKPVEGDFVLLYANLQEFKGTPEVKSGWITDFYSNSQSSFDPDGYTEATITEAKQMAAGANAKVSGKVAAFTYDSSMSRSGFLLTDGVDGLAVYDTSAAAQVEVGNSVTLCGTRENYISSSEQSAAAELGYTGARQLVDVTVVDNDEDTTAPNYSKAQTSTMREILATPGSTNITGDIYRVTGFVHKQEGGNFVNYYIDDLDGETGTYAYTNASGKDYAWLDEFDGKVCDIVLAVQNAKSSSTGLLWRVMPLQAEVIEDFEFDESKIPQFALDYYVSDLFEDTYQADPAMEVPTSLESPNEYVDLSGVTISYESSDTNIAYFESQDGKTYFHASEENTGDVTITATANLEGQESATFEKAISVVEPPKYDAITVKEASALYEQNVEVTVRGVVGPSTTNQNGFYLIDETGSIPCILSEKAALETVAIGQTVVVKGTAMLKHSGSSTFGQIEIGEAQILHNEYGNTPYSKESFITGSSISEIKALDYSDSTNTLKVFILDNVKIQKTDAMYPTYYILDNSVDTAAEDWTDYGIQLYSSSESQYAWLDDFVSPVSLELAICNYNSKTYIRGCVLSVTDATHTGYNTLNVRAQD